MSLVSILWFLSTLLACWGAALSARGLRGEQIKLRRPTTASKASPSEPSPQPVHQRPKWRPTWTLLAVGSAASASGFAMGWWAIGISRELDTSFGGQGHITPWHAVAAGLGMFAILLFVWALFGDRARGRFRCHKCWYDLSGLPLSTLPTPCAECGNTIKTPQDLTHARRHRKTAGFGLALLLLAGVGLWVMTRGPTPAAALPNRILVWLYWQGDVPSPWIIDEINRREPSSIQSQTKSPIATTHQALADHLAVTWINRTLEDGPASVALRFNTVAYHFKQTNTLDSKLNLTLAQVRDAWHIQVRYLLQQSQNPAAGVRRASTSDASQMPGFFLALLARTPGAEPLDEFTDHPAVVLGLPEFTPEELEQFRGSFKAKPELAYCLPPLLGPQILELCPNAMRDSLNLFVSDSRYVMNQVQWIGVSGRANLDILDEAIAMLSDPDPNQVSFGLSVLRIAADGPANLPFSPADIATIRAQLQSSFEANRWKAWRILRNEGLLTADDIERRSRLPILTAIDLQDLYWLPRTSSTSHNSLDLFALAERVLATQPNDQRLQPILNFFWDQHADDPAVLPMLEHLALSTNTHIQLRAEMLREKILKLDEHNEARDSMPNSLEAQPSPSAGDG